MSSPSLLTVIIYAALVLNWLAFLSSPRSAVPMCIAAYFALMIATTRAFVRNRRWVAALYFILVLFGWPFLLAFIYHCMFGSSNNNL